MRFGPYIEDCRVQVYSVRFEIFSDRKHDILNPFDVIVRAISGDT